MVIAFAGRRVQSIGGDHDAAALRIRRLLSALAPSAVVGALADGGDLLVAEAALGMADGPAVYVILPTPEDVFREDSVDEAWRGRFDRALLEIRRRGTVESLSLEPSREAYMSANVAFLDRAEALATDGQRAVVLVVAAEDEGAMGQDLVKRARLRNVPSLHIDPNVILTERPRAFVDVPNGVIYTKILTPALEDAQLFHRHATEKIDRPTDADLVIALDPVSRVRDERGVSDDDAIEVAGWQIVLRRRDPDEL